MKRCPICRGSVDEVTFRCMRCDADLHVLSCVEKKSHDYCYRAIRSILEEDDESARVHAFKALSLMRTPLTHLLSRFVLFRYLK